MGLEYVYMYIFMCFFICFRDVCSNCDRMFSQTCVSPEQMNILCKQIHDNIVVTDNVYKTTTPRELKDFIKFVKEHGPFSCVIDGLNTGFLLGQGSFIHYKSGIWQKVWFLCLWSKTCSSLCLSVCPSIHLALEAIPLRVCPLFCRDPCFVRLKSYSFIIKLHTMNSVAVAIEISRH